MGQIFSHRVNILGREFVVKSPASPEKVNEIEQFLHARLDVVARAVAVGDSQAAVSLALLNLAGEYMLLQDELSLKKSEGSERLESLISRMDAFQL